MARDEERRNDGSKEESGRRRYVLYGAAGIGLLAAAGAGYLLYREKSVEKPDHEVLEEDGQFQVRRYPELLVAETSVSGNQDSALDLGFSRLVNYIFGHERSGGKIAMTAPVLFGGEDGDRWRTRFVMPRAMTRETLPPAGADVEIATMPARKVAVVEFSGGVDEETLAEREAQLRSWMGAKKLEAKGEAERAFYNSPFVPGPLRRTEIMIPVG